MAVFIAMIGFLRATSALAASRTIGGWCALHHSVNVGAIEFINDRLEFGLGDRAIAVALAQPKS